MSSEAGGMVEREVAYAREALDAWDRYEPDVSVEKMVNQANDMANAIRRLLAALTP